MKLVLALLAVVPVAGCALGPVNLGEGPQTVPPACSSLMETVPVVVDGQQIRAVTPERADAVAWGNPPILLLCGVTPPEDLTATSSLIDIGGVTWFAQPLRNGTAFFTVDRSATVEIRVPRDFEPEASIVVELAPYIADAVPLNQ